MIEHSKIATEQGPLFPHIEVSLIGESSDMRVIMTKVRKALKAAGVSEAKVTQFTEEIFACDSYHHALNICLRWVNFL